MQPGKLTNYSCAMNLPDNKLKPLIIPVFLPHAGCPHKCIFCNQKVLSQSQSRAPSKEEIESSIRKYTGFVTPERKPVQIAFFGGNFLGIDTKEIIRLLHIAKTFVSAGTVDSIRFSTRPDTITEKRLEILKDFPVSTIEIGSQSMNDDVLALSERGHTALDTVLAARLLKERNYETGLQMMTGLPGDSDDGALSTALKIADLCPDFVRIYPAVVLKHSRLEKLFKTGRYFPMPLQETVSLVKKIFLIFKAKNISVIRMGLQASTDLEDGKSFLAGPYHPAFGHLVISEIYRDKAVQLLKKIPSDETVIIRVNPKRISAMRGLKNETISYLKDKFDFKHIVVAGDSGIEDHHISLTGCFGEIHGGIYE